MGGDAVTGLMVVLDGLDSGEICAVGIVELPPKVQAPEKIAVATRKPTARPRPLIFC